MSSSFVYAAVSMIHLVVAMFRFLSVLATESNQFQFDHAWRDEKTSSTWYEVAEILFVFLSFCPNSFSDGLTFLPNVIQNFFLKWPLQFRPDTPVAAEVVFVFVKMVESDVAVCVALTLVFIVHLLMFYSGRCWGLVLLHSSCISSMQ